MAIIVPIVPTDSWKHLLDAGNELGKLLSDQLEVNLSACDPAMRDSVCAYLKGSGLDSAGTPEDPAARRGARPLPADVLLLPGSARCNELTAGQASGARHHGPATLLVPEPGDVPAPLVPDGLIVLVSESGNFDSIEPWVERITCGTGCRIGLLTVIAPEAERDGRLATRFMRANRELHQLADGLRDNGVRATWEVRIGEPAEEISRLAETTGTNLIVLTQDDTISQPLIDALLDRSNLHLLIVG